MKDIVILESPYKGETETQQQDNIEYAKKALMDCLNRWESPFASHLLYTQVLDDSDPKQRKQGIETGLNYYNVADICAIYVDKGITDGMVKGIKKALEKWVIIEVRHLYDK